MSQQRLLPLLLVTLCFFFFHHPLPAMACHERNCNEDGILEVYGEYLYWEAVQDQIPYAARIPGGLQSLINAITSGQTTINPSISVIDLPFQWNSGFRLGLNYLPPCCEWEFQFAWTRLHQTVKGNINTTDSSIVPLNEPVTIALAFINRTAADFNLARAASGEWRFQYDIIDLLWGDNLACSDCLLIRPSIGVKMASISQKTISHYFGLSLATGGEPSLILPAGIKVQRTNKFLAAGPSIDLSSAYKFARQWAVSGGIGAALLYGKFTAYDRPMIFVGPNTVDVIAKGNKEHRTRPTVNAHIGVDWDGSICGQKIGVGVSYEWHYWWNQWQVLPNIPATVLQSGASPQGDLMLQGVTVRASLHF